MYIYICISIYICILETTRSLRERFVSLGEWDLVQSSESMADHQTGVGKEGNQLVKHRQLGYISIHIIYTYTISPTYLEALIPRVCHQWQPYWASLSSNGGSKGHRELRNFISVSVRPSLDFKDIPYTYFQCIRKSQSAPLMGTGFWFP